MSDTIDRESEAYREAIEVMARSEHEYLEQFGTPGAVHPCPPPIHALHVADGDDCDGTWTESDYPSWEDEDDRIKESHREDARRNLTALLAPSRVTCTICEGTGLVEMTNSPVYSIPSSRVSCPDCSDGTVEGPPVIYRVLGTEPPQTRVRSVDLTPGTVMEHRDSGHRVTLSHRKKPGDSDFGKSGWWNTDGSGLADIVIDDKDSPWRVYRVSDTRGPK